MKEEIVEEMAKEIESKKKIPKEEMNKINKRIFSNLIIACTIMLYFCFISLGYLNIERPVFITDLKVFSITLVLLSIILFEKSYKKDDGIICIYGIEVLILAIITLLSIYVSTIIENIFLLIIPIISYAFSIYYILKAIIIYKKMRKQYIKSLSDIKEIVKKEKPIKKTETTKKRNVNEEKVEEIKEEKIAKQQKKVDTKPKKETKEVSKTSKTSTTKKKTTNTTKNKTPKEDIKVDTKKEEVKTPEKKRGPGRPKKTTIENTTQQKGDKKGQNKEKNK